MVELSRNDLVLTLLQMKCVPQQEAQDSVARFLLRDTVHVNTGAKKK